MLAVMANPERTVVHRSQDGQFYYVHQAENGQDRETSETYTQQHDAERAAKDSFPHLPMIHARDLLDD